MTAAASPGCQVRVLFGPGGFVRARMFGEHGADAEMFELTAVAAELAAIGLRRSRGVCARSDSTAVIEARLGVGGRVMWFEGGGDISVSELVWAIAAALEQSTDDELHDALAGARRRRSDAFARHVDKVMVASGLSRRQRSAFISRRRRELDGRSIVELTDAGSADELRAAFAVVLRRVGDAVSASDLQVGWDDDP